MRELLEPAHPFIALVVAAVAAVAAIAQCGLLLDSARAPQSTSLSSPAVVAVKLAARPVQAAGAVDRPRAGAPRSN